MSDKTDQRPRRIADLVVNEILSRRGFRQEWDGMEEDVKQEIYDTLEKGIRGHLYGDALDPSVYEYLARAIEEAKKERNPRSVHPEQRSLSLAVTNMEQAGLWLCEYRAQCHLGEDALLDWLREVI